MALMGTEYGDKFVTNLQSFRKLSARVDMKGKDFKGLNELAKTLRRELVRSKTAHRQVVCAWWRVSRAKRDEHDKVVDEGTTKEYIHPPPFIRWRDTPPEGRGGAYTL